MDIKIGNRISELRKSKGITVNRLANKAGISQSYLREIELGNYENPSIDILDALCEALDISLKDFFTVNNETPHIEENLLNELTYLSPDQRTQLKQFLTSLRKQ